MTNPPFADLLISLQKRDPYQGYKSSDILPFVKPIVPFFIAEKESFFAKNNKRDGGLRGKLPSLLLK